jgi:hypothetical protein
MKDQDASISFRAEKRLDPFDTLVFQILPVCLQLVFYGVFD